MKILALISILSLFVSQAHALECYGETFSGKKVSIQFGNQFYPGNHGFVMTTLKIKINNKLVSEITKNVVSLRTTHDSVEINTKAGMLPSVELMFAENADREDRLSRLKVNLPGQGKFSFTDVVCE